MKSQAMRMYEARNVLADQPIAIWEPKIVNGRIVFDWRPASKDRARQYAELLFNGRNFQHIEEETRMRLINLRYIRGIEFRLDQLMVRVFRPKGGRRR
uniref:Uncharacterized protein n=1 Tax=uncultured bacterium Contig643 TaxID=1393602 RepID=W0FMP0_9BACT|nr:hypothetical protein [uncultured bacterium Contig643]